MSAPSFTFGNFIEFHGFHQIDSSSIIILRKVVGNFAKTLTDQGVNVSKISLHLSELPSHVIQGQIECEQKSVQQIITASADHENIFLSIGDCLNQMQQKLQSTIQ